MEREREQGCELASTRRAWPCWLCLAMLLTSWRVGRGSPNSRCVRLLNGQLVPPWPMVFCTTARSHLPDSPPLLSARDCSPLLSSGTTVPDQDRTQADLPSRPALRADPCVIMTKRHGTLSIIEF